MNPWLSAGIGAIVPTLLASFIIGAYIKSLTQKEEELQGLKDLYRKRLPMVRIFLRELLRNVSTSGGFIFIDVEGSTPDIEIGVFEKIRKNLIDHVGCEIEMYYPGGALEPDNKYWGKKALSILVQTGADNLPINLQICFLECIKNGQPSGRWYPMHDFWEFSLLNQFGFPDIFRMIVPD